MASIAANENFKLKSDSRPGAYVALSNAQFIAIDIPLSSHPLPSHTLPPMDDTIVDLLPEWGRLPARRPRTRRVH